MRKLLLSLMTLFLVSGTFSFFSKDVSAVNYGSMYYVAPTSVVTGTSFTADMVYKNISSKTVYMGNCSVSWGWSPSMAIPVTMQKVTVVNSKVGSITPNIIEIAGGGVSGNSSANTSLSVLSGPYKKYYEIAPNQTFTYKITFSVSSSLKAGGKITLNAKNPACTLRKDASGWDIIASPAITSTKTINVVSNTTTETTVPVTTVNTTTKEEPKIENKIDVKSKQGITVTGNGKSIEKVSGEGLKSIKKLTITSKEFGNIQFDVKIDLSKESTQKKFASLDQYVEFGEGYVEVDSKKFAELNKKAQITLIGLELDESKEIVILRDGKDAAKYVSNVKYDSEAKTLTFMVTGFSKYEVSEESYMSEVVEQEEIMGVEDVADEKDDSSLLLPIIVSVASVCGLVVVLIVIFFLRRRKKSTVKQDQSAQVPVAPLQPAA